MDIGQQEKLEEGLLWEMFLLGDDRAFSVFYKRYTDELFAYGMRFTSDRELVKDAVQDVFLKILSNRSQLKKTDKIKPYLYMALKNTLFNLFEKEQEYYTIDTVEPVFISEYSIEDEIVEGEEDAAQKKKVHRLLYSLPPRQKEVLYYRYAEGMKMDDICRLMNMNYQSVQNLIQRAIKSARRIYEENRRTFSRTINLKVITGI
ncbi:MAG: sigma-70 family RNA polymerase sigma factor [Tannerella sp.]|jgi:RNA polymerase sigma factor (sigma-70 family)|nr:sigma-70 family RNA polymerase sigma factor [Tannerella sp.]